MASTREHPVDVDRAAIARIAYRLWEDEGRQHGSDLRHWLEAEASLREEPRPVPPRPPTRVVSETRRGGGVRGPRHH